MKSVTMYGTPTCGPCKFMEGLFNSLLKSDGEHFTFTKINLHSEEGAAKGDSAGVTSAPTIIFMDEDGKELQRLVEPVGLKTLKDILGLA